MAPRGLTARVRASRVSMRRGGSADARVRPPALHGRSSPLCGNSIHQDRRFLARYMPQLDALPALPQHRRQHGEGAGAAAGTRTARRRRRRSTPTSHSTTSASRSTSCASIARTSFRAPRVIAATDGRMTRRLRLAVLLSGSGTTLQNLLDRIADGRLDAEVAVVVSSRADAFGLERARRAGIPAVAVARKAHPDVRVVQRRRYTPRSSRTAPTWSSWPASCRSSSRAPATPAACSTSTRR